VAVSEIELDALRQALNRRLDYLRQSIDSTADSRKPVELDQASVGRLSRMDAMQMQAMAQAAERMRGQEIERIKATLRRIDDGDFGYCISCGEEIAPKRLAIDPTIPTCIRCASGTDR
jgi:DnaK suppressor protein